MSAAGIVIKSNVLVASGLIIGYLNNAVIAGIFGLTHLVDAYFAALVLPTILMTLFVDYMGRNFLPILSDINEKNPEEASGFISTVITIVAALTLVGTLLLVLASRWLFGLMLPGFDSGNIEQVRNMFLIMSPAIVLMAINTFHQYLWQYREHYLRVVSSAVILPATLLLAILLGESSMGEYSIAAGYLAGNVVLFLYMTIGVGYRYSIRKKTDTENLRRLFLNTGILVTTGLVGRITPFLERYFASTLESGAISALAIGTKLCQPVKTGATMGLKLVAFTRSSKLVAAGQIEKAANLYRQSSLVIMLLISPIVIWAMLNADLIIQLLFMRGKFDQSMHDAMTLVLIGLLPGALFSSLAMVLNYAYYAMNKVIVPAFAPLLGTLVYVVSAIFALKQWGLLGLALAETVRSFVVLLVIIIFLGRMWKTFHAAGLCVRLSVYGFVSVASMYAGLFLARQVFPGQIVELVLSAFFGACVYVLILAVFRDGGFLYVCDKLGIRYPGRSNRSQ